MVVTPVARLRTFARELGARRYGARLPETGPPETIELAQAFNATAVSLEAAEAELRRLGERHLAELDAVFREAPLGLAFVDRDLRFLRVNEELARFNQRSVADHLGQEVADPDVRAALGEVIERRPRGARPRAHDRRPRLPRELLPGPRRRRRPAGGRRGGHRRHRTPPRRGRPRAPAAHHRVDRRGDHRARRRAGRGGGGARGVRDRRRRGPARRWRAAGARALAGAERGRAPAPGVGAAARAARRSPRRCSPARRSTSAIPRRSRSASPCSKGSSRRWWRCR